MDNLQAAKQALRHKKFEEERKKNEQEQIQNQIQIQNVITTAGVETVMQQGNYQIWEIMKAQKANLQDAIKAERKTQGLTQQQLANRAGMSETTISRFEKHGWASYEAVVKIINALGKQITFK